MNRATFNREVGASRMAGHLQEFGHAGHYSSDLHGWIQMGTAAPYRSVRDIRLRAKLEELKHSMRPRTSHGRAAAEHANRISGCEGSQRILQRYLRHVELGVFCTSVLLRVARRACYVLTTGPEEVWWSKFEAFVLAESILTSFLHRVSTPENRVWFEARYLAYSEQHK